MTSDDAAIRIAEFDALFASIPGRNIDRIRKIAGILHCPENTVRIYRLRTHNRRVIPASKLAILKEGIGRG